jgi:hypothetical protein
LFYVILLFCTPRLLCAAVVAPQDADIVGAEYMGQASIPVEMIIGGKTFDKWLKLEDQMGKVGSNSSSSSALHETRMQHVAGL